MPLIRVFYKTGEVFSALREDSWILPLLGFMAVAVLVTSLLIGNVGWAKITNTAEQLDSRASQFSAEKLQVLVLSGTAIKTAFRLAGAALAALAVHFLVWWTPARTGYGKILAICLYALYMQSAVNLVIMFSSAMYYRLAELPVGVYDAVRIHCGMLIGPLGAHGRVYEMAKSLDILTMSALLIAAFGFTKIMPRLTFPTAGMMTFTLWAAWAVVRVKLDATQ